MDERFCSEKVRHEWSQYNEKHMFIGGLNLPKMPKSQHSRHCRSVTKKISDDKNFADTKNLGFDRLSVNFCEFQQDPEKNVSQVLWCWSSSRKL